MAEELQSPTRRRWTRAQYERAIELGVFGPQEHLELIEGDIVERMPQWGPHYTAIILAQRSLEGAFDTEYLVRTQGPLALGDVSEPEPDVAVVVGSPRDYSQNHPASAVLVVEVSDSSLQYDRGTKSQLYAKANIPEYWIVNLQDRCLEVYRQPGLAAEQPIGYGYLQVERLNIFQSVSPQAAPGASIQVRDLLP